MIRGVNSENTSTYDRENMIQSESSRNGGGDEVDGSFGAMGAALEDARIMASLRHPNIVRFKEVFYDHKLKQIILVMEYANYYSLDRLITL